MVVWSMFSDRYEDLVYNQLSALSWRNYFVLHDDAYVFHFCSWIKNTNMTKFAMKLMWIWIWKWMTTWIQKGWKLTAGQLTTKKTWKTIKPKKDVVIECTKISRKCNRKKFNFDCRYGLEIYFFRQSNHFSIIFYDNYSNTSKALKKYLDLLINNCWFQ